MPNAIIINKIAELFRRKGASLYGGEAVTQQEHALQAAMLAEDNGAGAALISAALLHDVGHLLHELPDDAPDQGVDDVHERLGYEFLRRKFVAEVAEPVRLHVAAKRYLCATDAEYFSALSPPSVQSLQMQGGPFTPSEARDFEEHPYFQQSIDLRRWDDLAKVAHLATPELSHFLSYLPDVMLTQSPVEASL